MTVDAVLFDLDRTLVDVQSHTDYPAALSDVEAMIGSWTDPPTPPTGWDGPTRRCMGILVALSGDPRWQAVSEAIERHETAAESAADAMPGLPEALRLVAGLPTAVVTLLPAAVAERVLRRNRVAYQVLVPRRSDLRPKPAPDQIYAATASLGVDPGRTVMIGDSTWDETAAHSAGCRFVGVTNGGASEFGPATPVGADLNAAVRVALDQ